MGIANEKRASSMLSAATNMSYSPESANSAARERFEHNRRSTDREKRKDDIERRLQNDKQAIWAARAKVRKAAAWDSLDQRQQERLQKEAALETIQLRKDRGQHVSSVYPVFADFLPAIAEGKRSTTKDVQKDVLVFKQLDLLEGQDFRAHRDEESDDDEPNPFSKKQEDENPPDLRQIPAYVPKRPAAAAAANGKMANERDGDKTAGSQRRRSAARVKVSNSSANGDNDDREENEDYKSGSEELSQLESETEEKQDSYPNDDDNDSEEESPNAPLVAVLRGAPIPETLIPYTPSKETLHIQRLAAIRRRQQLAKNADHGLVAVLRGQIKKKPDEHVDTDIKRVWVAGKGFVSRKRVREAEGVEDRGQEQKKNKKSK
jgi:hypothetical protein